MNVSRIFRICLLVSVLSVQLAGRALAQIELNTKLEQVVFLQFEPVIAVTDVKSRIGQPVVFNSNPDGPNFYYEVRNEYGHELAPLPDVSAPEPVLVPAQADAGFTNNMLRLYPMSKPGFYSIQPCVTWMGKIYRGEKRHLEIVGGREVTRITGMVSEDKTFRTYVVLHVNRGQQDHILLRIDDEQANLCYGVFSLGRSVLNETPQLAVDASGNAHVLFQSAPRMYTHLSFSPFGTQIERQSFDRAYVDVALNSEPDGSIIAKGKPAPKSKTPLIQSILEKQ